jgi:hypothetical protein
VTRSREQQSRFFNFFATNAARSYLSRSIRNGRPKSWQANFGRLAKVRVAVTEPPASRTAAAAVLEILRASLAAPPIERHLGSLQRSVRQLLRIRAVTARYGRQDIKVESVFKFAQPLPLGPQRISVWAGFV